MNARGAMWFTLSWIMFPAGVALGLLFIRSEQPAAHGYGLAAATTAGSAIVLLAPVAMVLAAVCGSRWESAGWRARDAARSSLAVIADVLWPLAAAGSLALFAVLALAGSGLSGVVAVGPSLALLLIGMILLGFGLGVRLPLRLAAPLSVVGGYAFFAFPLVVEPTWLRQVTGIWWGCCSISRTLDSRAAVAVAAVGLGLAGAGFVMAAWGRVWASLAVAAAGIALGVLVVGKSGPDPSVVRTGDMVCQGKPGVGEVCVWPEHQGSLDGLAAQAPAAVRVATALSMAVPPTFTEDAAKRLGYFALEPGAPAEMTTYAFVMALLPDFDDACQARVEALPSSDPYDAVDAARAQLASELGLTRSEIRRLAGAQAGAESIDVSAVQGAILTCDLARLTGP